MMPFEQQFSIDGRHVASRPVRFAVVTALAAAFVGLVYIESRAAQRENEVATFMATCLRRDYDAASRTIQKNPWMTKFRHSADGNTLLHWAALQPDTMPTLLLLQHGAEVNAVNDAGRTPYHYAANARNIFVARILQRRGGGDGPNTDNTPFQEVQMDRQDCCSGQRRIPPSAIAWFTDRRR